MSQPIDSLSTAAVDQLGERLRRTLTVEDLRLLDQYRREFGPDYAVVVTAVREALGLEASGRPAKSTTAIVDKLNRGSMRLSQMQDIAGCRVVVADTLAQDAAVSHLTTLFQSTIVDRRERASHGYRAVHVVLRPRKRPIEVQVRTVLQHLWAEFSEKAADTYGIEVKYGGGHKTIRNALDSASELVANFERLEPKREQFGNELTKLRSEIESNLLKFLAVMKEPQ
jgi:putative GTP pyrophosphokinase